VLATALAGALILASPCFSQFGPFETAVVNSASYYTGPIAQGSIFIVYGFSLGPADLVQANTLPLQLQLAGTSVAVTSGGATFNCPMVYTSSTQVAAILPSNTPVGPARLAVTYRGTVGFGTQFTVASSAFGIYAVDSSGLGPGIITGSDFKTKTFNQPARGGEVLIAWGTGLGAIDSGDAAPPTSIKQFSNVEVLVGNQPATVYYAVRSGCCAGLDQIAFQVPDIASQGCFIPVNVRTAGTIVSNFATVAISTGGEPCSNTPPGLPAPLLSRAIAGQPLKLGIFAVGPARFLEFFGFPASQSIAENISALLHALVSEADVKFLIQAYRAKQIHAVSQILNKYGFKSKRPDLQLARKLQTAIGTDQQYAAAAFGTFSSLSAFSSQFAANFPPAGVCTVVREVMATRFEAQSLSINVGSALTLNSPGGQRSIPRTASGQYEVSLGTGLQGPQVAAGTYTITGSGSSGVGPIAASLNISSTLTWTNKSAVTSIDRTQPLTLTWAGGMVPGFVLIGAVAQVSGANRGFLCSEQTQKGSFTIPSFVLSGLPPVSSSSAYLFVSPHPLANTVTVPGLDLAYFINGSSDFKAVEFR